jgi:cell filamentation protein
MSNIVANGYNYIDPDNLYTDKQSGVLRNKLGIKDGRLLAVTESLETAKRLEELERTPVVISSSAALLSIHYHLFQNLYDWAGKLRKVNISKGGKPFFPLQSFDKGFKYLDSLVEKCLATPSTDKKQISGLLAEILDTTNYLHPFREGNGRTQREFLRALALQKGYRLNLNPPNDPEVYEKYMRGTIEGDISLLNSLISLVMKP